MLGNIILNEPFLLDIADTQWFIVRTRVGCSS